MKQPDPARVQELFEAVCDRPASERTAYLNEATAGDPALRAEVESLLSFDRTSNDILSDGQLGRDRIASSVPGAEPVDDLPLPERVGAFRVVRRIGAGGMGTVYEAEQASPRRRVALKVMRQGADSRALARRFQREGQIQATLVHPGIAAVYETGIDTVVGGATPYFAMELVEGEPIHEFARTHKLGMRDKLRLMAEVCDAVSFAHQRGVIHRDLKPDNVLVQQTSAGPRPKVLDFGVAKLTDHDLRATTMETEAGKLVGTLAYMSPEQLAGRADEIDTRTDIYALGVILYELLAGRACFDLRDVPIAEAVRRMTEEEPARLGSLNAALRGDVETIVQKAMEREKTRRYSSVSELAMDIRRYLSDEPITARPTTVLYQATKFARRHRAIVTGGMLAILALIAGVIATAIQARAAIKARDAADKEAEISHAVTETLRGTFFQSTAESSKGKDPTLREAIDRTTGRIDEKFEGPPEAEAIVRNTIGIVQREAGEYEKAGVQFQKALEIRRRVMSADSLEIAEVLHNLALTRTQSGHSEAALPLLTEAYEIQRRVLGPGDPVVLRSLFNLARVHSRLKRYDSAKSLTEESLELHQKYASDNKQAIGMHHGQLSGIERQLGNFAEAERHAVQSVSIIREEMGNEAPSLAVSLLELALVRLKAGNAAGAEAPINEADQIVRRVFAASPQHPTPAAIRAARRDVFAALGKPDPDPPPSVEQEGAKP